jgi:hypothetical protein
MLLLIKSCWWLDETGSRAYPAHSVLNTPLEAECPAPDSRGFFTSIVFLWPGSGQRYNTGESRESCKPSSSGVQVPGRSSEQGAKFEHISKEAIMAAKSISASARCKSKSVVVHSKATYLTPEMRRQKARKEFLYFFDNATKAEMRVIGHIKPYDYGFDPVKIMKEVHRLLSESIARCKVIPFPASRIRQSKILEA